MQSAVIWRAVLLGIPLLALASCGRVVMSSGDGASDGGLVEDALLDGALPDGPAADGALGDGRHSDSASPDLPGDLFDCGDGSFVPRTRRCDGTADCPNRADEQGCCAGCMVDGECVDGTTDTACGRGGGACAVCAGGEVCEQGQCLRRPECSPSSCDGCCSGTTCAPGTADSACGDRGIACMTCGAGSKCQKGSDGRRGCVIPCGPATCGGCCRADGTCVTASDAECGKGGESCKACAQARCMGGTCVPKTCFETCSGCCAAETCDPGTSDSGCGSSGQVCEICAAGTGCRPDSHTCRPNAGTLWDFLIFNVLVPATGPDGSAWDPFGGLPDPYVTAVILNPEDPQAYATGESSSQEDTVEAYWGSGEAVISNLSEHQLYKLILRVMDDDGVQDDVVCGRCEVDIGNRDFSTAVITPECPDCPGVVIRYRFARH